MSQKADKILNSLLMMACLIAIGLEAILLFIVPKFEAAFEDFDTEFSLLTIQIINFSKWLGGRMTETQFVAGAIPVTVMIFAAMAGLIVWRKHINKKLAQPPQPPAPAH